MTKILIVDDEEEIRCLIRDFLVKDNFETDEASGGREALVKLSGKDKYLELKTLHSRQEYLLREERYYAQLFRQYAQEFGLTPKGRVGLSVSTDAGVPEGADLLS